MGIIGGCIMRPPEPEKTELIYWLLIAAIGLIAVCAVAIEILERIYG